MKDHSFPAFSLPAKGLYLDYNSTTPPAPFLDWKELIGVWGNPSSRHREGQRAKAKFGEARKNIARFLGASPLELVATSGGTEANNLFLKGVFEESFPKNPERNEIICSAVEHSSVMAPLKQLQAKGAKIIKIPVSVEGALDMEAYKRALSKKNLNGHLYVGEQYHGWYLSHPKNGETGPLCGGFVSHGCHSGFRKNVCPSPKKPC